MKPKALCLKGSTLYYGYFNKFDMLVSPILKIEVPDAMLTAIFNAI